MSTFMLARYDSTIGMRPGNPSVATGSVGPLMISSTVMSMYSSATGPGGGVGGREDEGVLLAALALPPFGLRMAGLREAKTCFRNQNFSLSTASRLWAVCMFSATRAMGMRKLALKLRMARVTRTMKM